MTTERFSESLIGERKVIVTIYWLNATTVLSASQWAPHPINIMWILTQRAFHIFKAIVGGGNLTGIITTSLLTEMADPLGTL